MSHTESTPCTRVRIRSSPAPVSMEGRGSGVRVPSAAWSNCMKTRFQNSMKRSPAGSASGPPSGPYSAPRSMCSSEQGPQGPVSPICQKLSASPRRWMRSSGHADRVVPDLLGLVVRGVHGDPQPVAVEPEVLGDVLPRPGDGLLLEVVPEAEVAHHLEEDGVAPRAADVVEVVVLAARPHALLHVRGPLERGRLVAGEVRLERHHPGHREQHRRIVRDQAGRRHDRVVAVREEAREGPAQLVGGAGRRRAWTSEPICEAFGASRLGSAQRRERRRSRPRRAVGGAVLDRRVLGRQPAPSGWGRVAARASCSSWRTSESTMICAGPFEPSARPAPSMLGWQLTLLVTYRRSCATQHVDDVPSRGPSSGRPWSGPRSPA